jgi:hypothetical protein
MKILRRRNEGWRRRNEDWRSRGNENLRHGKEDSRRRSNGDFLSFSTVCTGVVHDRLYTRKKDANVDARTQKRSLLG